MRLSIISTFSALLFILLTSASPLPIPTALANTDTPSPTPNLANTAPITPVPESSQLTTEDIQRAVEAAIFNLPVVVETTLRNAKTQVSQSYSLMWAPSRNANGDYESVGMQCVDVSSGDEYYPVALEVMQGKCTFWEWRGCQGNVMFETAGEHRIYTVADEEGWHWGNASFRCTAAE